MEIINHSGAETGVFTDNFVNTLAPDTLALCVASGPFYQHGLTFIPA